MQGRMRWGWFLSFILMSCDVVAAVEDLNPEGKFRFIPGLMMIGVLVLFVVVGLFTRTKNKMNKKDE